MNWETGVDIYTVLILHIKSMSKDLVYSTGNSLSVMWQPGWGIHVYVWLSPFAVHLKVSQHC